MDRSVLVTGTSSGIGRATVVHLARQGFHVVATVRTEDQIADVARAARDEAGTDVEVLTLDVTDEEACARAVAGRELYGLVNNAGYFNVGPMAEIGDDDVRRQLETMVVAPMRLARLVVPGMRERGRGRIVNVSSAITHLAAALTGWYQSSKSALSAATDALRMEVADQGIEVVRIEPGGIHSRIWRKAEHDLLRRRTGSAYVTSLDRALDVLYFFEGRMGAPEAVAATVGRALTARRPRVRYRVGADAYALEALDVVLPARARDRVVRAVLGL